VAATVIVGNSPHGIAITPDGASAYVTNQTSNNVSVINTANNTVVATVNVGLGPIGAASGPAALAKLNNFTALVGVSSEHHATAVAGQFHPVNAVDPLTQPVTFSVAGSNSASVTFASFTKVGTLYSASGRTGVTKVTLLLSPLKNGNWGYLATLTSFVPETPCVTVSLTIGTQSGSATVTAHPID
jgi:YVTN family beta-propeller protein